MIINKILGALQDLLFDGDNPKELVKQTRLGQEVYVNKINSHTIPVKGQYGKTGFISIFEKLSFLGCFDEAPTDNLGEPLRVGNWYWNTASNAQYIWNGERWVTNVATPDNFMLKGANLSDVLSVEDSKDNLRIYEPFLNLFNTYNELNKIVNAVKEAVKDDIGEIVVYPFKVNKKHLLELNGQYVKRKDYPQLWSLFESVAIDDTDDIRYSGYFTKGDGSTTFRLPDYRGLFLRSFDDGRGLNPLKSNKLGDYVEDHFKEHSHRIVYSASNFDNRCVDTDDCNTNVNDGWTMRRATTDKAGWLETNPKYVSVVYYIKAK